MCTYTVYIYILFSLTGDRWYPDLFWYFPCFARCSCRTLFQHECLVAISSILVAWCAKHCTYQTSCWSGHPKDLAKSWWATRGTKESANPNSKCPFYSDPKKMHPIFSLGPTKKSLKKKTPVFYRLFSKKRKLLLFPRKLVGLNPGFNFFPPPKKKQHKAVPPCLIASGAIVTSQVFYSKRKRLLMLESVSEGDGYVKTPETGWENPWFE